MRSRVPTILRLTQCSSVELNVFHLKIRCLEHCSIGEFVGSNHAWQDREVKEPSLCPSIDFHACISFSVEHCLPFVCLKVGGHSKLVSSNHALQERQVENLSSFPSLSIKYIGRFSRSLLVINYISY